jgi:hypothetical protein
MKKMKESSNFNVELKSPEGTPNWSSKKYHSGFKALLCIGDFKGSSEKHYAQLMKIEGDLDALNKNASAIIEANHSPELLDKWETTLTEIKRTILSINQVLNAAKDKVAKQDRTDFSGFWRQLDADLDQLKQAYTTIEGFGIEKLPENEHVRWQKNFSDVGNTILPAIISHVETSKVELELIEKYTQEQLNEMMQAIIVYIPEDFSFEEANKYEQDYIKALADYEKEFSTDKNWWDTFLDILSGGAHQSPAERVMMKSWVEGEKIKV